MDFSGLMKRYFNRGFGVSGIWVGFFLVFCLSVLGCLSPDETDAILSPDAPVEARDSALNLDATREPDLGIDTRTADIFEPIIADQSIPIDAEIIDADLPDAIADMGPTTGAYTTAQVDEIFQRDCGSCHNSTASPPLNNGVMAWVNRGSGQSRLRLIQPGNHEMSYLYHKLADTHRDPPSNGSGTGMPMGRQLYSASRMERMALWMDQL